MSLYSNSSQLYFDFVYSDYFNKYSEFKYLPDLIKVIDWFVVPAFNHKYGRFGYSNQSILKALFVQKIKSNITIISSTIKKGLLRLVKSL